MKFKVIKEKGKKTDFIYIFYCLGGQMFFAYVLVRDQNLVVRGRNYCLIGFVFF